MICKSSVRCRVAWMRAHGHAEEAEALQVRMVTRWSERMLELMHCRLEVQGQEHIPHGEAFVVFSNHQSMYDIPVLVTALRRPLGFVVKRELFWIPGLAYWMRQINSMSLDRGDVHGGAEALARFGGELKRRRRGFIIFPEGTRSRDPAGTVRPFRRGALRLASEHDLPVLPVTIDGTRLIDQPRMMAATRTGDRLLRVRIDPPRRLPSNTAPARKRFMDELYETIRSNREAIRVDWLQR